MTCFSLHHLSLIAVIYQNVPHTSSPPKVPGLSFFSALSVTLNLMLTFSFLYEGNLPHKQDNKQERFYCTAWDSFVPLPTLFLSWFPSPLFLLMPSVPCKLHVHPSFILSYSFSHLRSASCRAPSNHRNIHNFTNCVSDLLPSASLCE